MLRNCLLIIGKQNINAPRTFSLIFAPGCWILFVGVTLEKGRKCVIWKGGSVPYLIWPMSSHSTILLKVDHHQHDQRRTVGQHSVQVLHITCDYCRALSATYAMFSDALTFLCSTYATSMSTIHCVEQSQRKGLLLTSTASSRSQRDIKRESTSERLLDCR